MTTKHTIIFIICVLSLSEMHNIYAQSIVVETEKKEHVKSCKEIKKSNQELPKCPEALAPAVSKDENTAAIKRVRSKKQTDLASATSSGLISSVAASPKFEGQVVATTGNSTVSIAYTYRENFKINRQGEARTRDITITGTSPLNDNDSKTDLATLDGLSSSSNIALTYKKTVTSGFNDIDDVKNSCDYDLLIEMVRENCMVEARKDDVVTATEKQHCETSAVEFNLTKLQNEQLMRACKIIDEQNAKTRFYGGSAKIGHEQFDTLDPIDFSKSTSSRNPLSLSAFYGLVWPQDHRSILFGTEYQEAYKAADSSILCMPADDPTQNISCQSGSFSAPNREEKRLLFVEYRQNLGSIAIEPRITFDFEEDVVGIDLPVFIWKNKDKKLSAGFRAGWRDDTDEVTFGVFVGNSFDHHSHN